MLEPMAPGRDDRDTDDKRRQHGDFPPQWVSSRRGRPQIRRHVNTIGAIPSYDGKRQQLVRFSPPFRSYARIVTFRSPLHSERVAARLGLWLGIAFLTCFATGLISHYMQQQPQWLHWPASPAWLYRATQGVHVATGMASVPLLVAKMWTVYPKLFVWPPARSMLHAVERGSLFLLVGGAAFQLISGLINIALFYPWRFFFTSTHYWVAWITIGALFIHVAAKITEIRRGLRTPLSTPDEPDRAPGSLSRRGFIATTAASSTAVTLVTVGQSATPLKPLAVLGPRHGDIGPQRLPVNKSAVQAGVLPTAHDPSYRLTIVGPRHIELTVEQLEAMPQHAARLPIACVEGWSAGADWSGVRVADLLDLAGIDPEAEIYVESMQRGGRYRASFLRTPHSRDPRTLLALRLNGSRLSIDHGYPCRLIAPDRPGVLQTKWVNRMTVVT